MLVVQPTVIIGLVLLGLILLIAIMSFIHQVVEPRIAAAKKAKELASKDIQDKIKKQIETLELELKKPENQNPMFKMMIQEKIEALEKKLTPTSK